MLLARALELTGGWPAAGVLAEAARELSEGQHADVAFEERHDVTSAECLRMSEQKTGALLGAACQLGARAGGADVGAARHYRTFGRHLGLAFQLIDDLLGIWGDPQVTGKPAGSDLAARKKSLPVVWALASGTPAGRRLRALYCRGREPLDEPTIRDAAALVDAAGGRSWARAEATRQLRVARDALARARPKPAGAARLHLLADLIVCRDH